MHPFDDVPTWAKNYVGWAYEKGYTEGISPTKFGSDNMIAKSYLTLVLRSLGYDDSDGDFSWDQALVFANEKELISNDELAIYNKNLFVRDYVSKISYNALTTSTKNGTRLCDKLLEQGSVSKDSLLTIGVAFEEDVSNFSDLVELSIDDGLYFYNRGESYQDNILSIDFFINRGELPEAVRDFVNISFPRWPKTMGSIEQLYIEDHKAEHFKGDLYNSAGYSGSVDENFEENINVLFLFNSLGEAIAYHEFDASNINIHLEKLIDIDIEFTGTYTTDYIYESFHIKKYDGGVEDQSYNLTNVSVSYSYSDLEKDKNNVRIATYKNVFKANEDVTFEVESISPDIKVIGSSTSPNSFSK